jgi:sugar lactone lactonase YvrE
VLATAGILAMASAHGTSYQGPPLQVTAANTIGNSIYNLKLNTNTSPNPNSALISGTQAPLNSDGAKHGAFDAIVWAPNSHTGTLDLIASDIVKSQIVRYSGPSYGTGTVIFNWAAKGKGSGPAYPVGLSVDPTGNLYVISPSSKQDPTPSLWVLPYGATTGTYGAPILIDDSFGGVKTLALAEVLVAGSAATADGAAAPAWNAGDLLVLIGDSFNARVIVYTEAAINGVINTSRALSGPSSTAVTLAQFRSKNALPLGMDIWPPDATTKGVSLLFATVDGRLIRFDSSQEAFIADFADGFGVNVQRVKVGTYLNVPYAFVAQLLTFSGGEILQYGAPPAGRSNTTPLAKIAKGLEGPFGLAVTTSGSTPAADCIAPNTCSPIGPQLTLQLSGPGTINNPALANAQILDTACSVPTDPRVQIVDGIWSCNGGTLDVANYCPGFPHTVLPPFLCGHSGSSGAAFQVVEGTALAVDENANNVFFTTVLDPTVPLPGPYDLTCPKVPMLFPLLPMVAWAPRSDLPTVEGTIVEDLTTPFFIDTIGFCDSGGSNLKGASMYAFGLGLNAAPSGLGSGSGSGLPGFVNTKFDNLLSTIQAATTIATNVSMELQGYVQQSQAYFNSAVNNNVVDGFSCAANSIASADAFARAQFAAFQPGIPPAGNYNPLGEIDGRLANLFLTIDAYFLMQAPNTTWPAMNVPPCVTLSASPTTVTTGTAVQLSWGPATPTYPLTYPPTSCTVSGSQGTLLTTPFTGGGSGTVSTGNLTAPGAYIASLDCSAGGGSTALGLAAATVTVTAQPVLQSIAVSPQAAAVATGASQPFAATGTYNVGNPQNITGQVSWSAVPTSVATVNASGVATCVASATSGSATITATGAGGVQGSATLNCQAPTPPAPAISSFAPVPSGYGAPQPVIGSPNTYAMTYTLVNNVPTGLAVLQWTTTNATACTLSNPANVPPLNDPSAGPANTSYGVNPPIAVGSSVTTAYTLSCQGAGGTAMATLTLIVGTPPVVMLTASPNPVAAGQTTALTWTSSGELSADPASSCQFTAGGVPGSQAVNGTAQTPPLAAGTYTASITCTSPEYGQSASASVNVNVTAPASSPTLNNPNGLAMAANGNLYTASYGSGQVLVFASGQWGTAFYGQMVLQPSQTLSAGLTSPVRLAFDQTSSATTGGYLYVADTGSAGNPASIVAYNPSGVMQSSYTAVTRPLGIAVDANSRVLVADNEGSGNGSPGNVNDIQVLSYSGSFSKIAVLTQDANELAFQSVGALEYKPATGDIAVAIAGSEEVPFYAGAVIDQSSCGAIPCLPAPASGVQPTLVLPTFVSGPTGVAFDPTGNIYVTNYGGTPVIKYQTGTATTLPLTLSGTPSPAIAQPEGIAIDSTGNIYVSNTPNNVIYVYNSSGVYQYSVGNIALNAVDSYASGGIATTSAVLNWTTPGYPATATCALSSTDGAYANTAEPLSSPNNFVVTPLPTAALPITYTLTCGVAGGTSSVASVQVPSVSIVPTYENNSGNPPPNGQAYTTAKVSTAVQFNWAAAGIPSTGTCYLTDGYGFNNSAYNAEAVSISYFLPATPGPYTISIYCTTGSTTTNTATWTLNLTP